MIKIHNYFTGLSRLINEDKVAMLKKLQLFRTLSKLENLEIDQFLRTSLPEANIEKHINLSWSSYSYRDILSTM
jgi:hypothetical protein